MSNENGVNFQNVYFCGNLLHFGNKVVFLTFVNKRLQPYSHPIYISEIVA